MKAHRAARRVRPHHLARVDELAVSLVELDPGSQIGKALCGRDRVRDAPRYAQVPPEGGAGSLVDISASRGAGAARVHFDGRYVEADHLGRNEERGRGGGIERGGRPGGPYPLGAPKDLEVGAARPLGAHLDLEPGERRPERVEHCVERPRLFVPDGPAGHGASGLDKVAAVIPHHVRRPELLDQRVEAFLEVGEGVRVGEVKDVLAPPLERKAKARTRERGLRDPLGVLTRDVACRADHLGSEVEPELQPQPPDVIREGPQPLGEDRLVDVPVPESAPASEAASSLEPSVSEDEELRANDRRGVGEGGEALDAHLDARRRRDDGSGLGRVVGSRA